MDDTHRTQPKTQTAIRTLTVAGYTIERTHWQPRPIEILCKRTDMLRASIPYLIAVTDADKCSEAEMNGILRSASNQGRIPVIVTPGRSEKTISGEDFTEVHGGAVPSWQALSSEYDQALGTAARNKLPTDVTHGKAGLIFED